MDISRIGSSIIHSSRCDLFLNNVLHVPFTHKNLISVHHFTLDNDTFMELHPYFFLIKDQKMKKVLLHGPCKGGLYPLPPSTSKFRKFVFSALKISVDRWHSWLGHPSRDIVHRVVSNNNLPCANFDWSNSSVCDACACAKAHQLLYQLSSLLCSLYFLMSGVMLLNLLVARDIMFSSLMIIVSLLGYIKLLYTNRFT
jgi:hypothetical protein